MLPITNSWGLRSVPLALPDVVFTRLVVCNALPYVRPKITQHEHYSQWKGLHWRIPKLNERRREIEREPRGKLSFLNDHFYGSVASLRSQQTRRGEGNGEGSESHESGFIAVPFPAPTPTPRKSLRVISHYGKMIEIHLPKPFKNSVLNWALGEATVKTHFNICKQALLCEIFSPSGAKCIQRSQRKRN